MNILKNSNFIKNEAYKLGFSFCGIAAAKQLDKEAKQLENWLKSGNHGKMKYMENHFDKRIDPRKLVPGAKSIICLAYNYYPEKVLPQTTYKIARYAYGEDYHHVIKEKLNELIIKLSDTLGVFEGRMFTDSAPVMERQWANYAGIGWLGKNTLLLNRNMGSYFFLATIICDWELNYDNPIKDYCGTCTACIDACPTQAINPNGYLEANKCISYLTIELKDAIPNEFKNQMENWAFGCDICQEVCPWNKFSIAHKEEKFNPNSFLLSMKEKDWEELNSATFSKVFSKSAVKRTKLEGLNRNIAFLKANKKS